LPTKEETQNGTSLIFVDIEKYPNAKALDLKLPKLARYYNVNSKKKELVIIIQGVKILKDSIVGFRYINGGNGSARMSEVAFLSDAEIKHLLPARFVSLKVKIKATQNKVWDVITNPKFRNTLQPSINESLIIDRGNMPKINFKSLNESVITSEFEDKLYGNYYIQIDYTLEEQQLVEKFILIENKQTKSTELQLVCGPYQSDFKDQELKIDAWVKKVKELSEER